MFKQSNREYELVDWIHEAIDEGSAIIINPAAFSFTSMAIMDALKMFPGPIIELHISNIHKREPIYHKSLMSAVATAVIAGLGPNGYPTAVRAMRTHGRGVGHAEKRVRRWRATSQHGPCSWASLAPRSRPRARRACMSGKGRSRGFIICIG